MFIIVYQVMNKTQKAILKTLAFFEILGRPLVLEELWRFLYQIRASKLQVLLALKNLQKKQMISQKNKYYFLKNHQNTYRTFEEDKNVQEKNWRKVYWVLKILSRAPFVKNISVINSLAFGTSNQNSDIDILIIAQKNRLWTARAFVILLLEIIGQNKNQWYRAGKFCLGFAFDETQLDLESVMQRKYILSPFWLANLIPVFDRQVYQNLILENQWLSQDLPNWSPPKIEAASTKLSVLEKFLLGHFGDRLEKWLAKIQIKRVWLDPKNQRAVKGSVIANQHMLKIHPADRRPIYQRRWEDLTKRLLLL